MRRICRRPFPRQAGQPLVVARTPRVGRSVPAPATPPDPAPVLRSAGGHAEVTVG